MGDGRQGQWRLDRTAGGGKERVKDVDGGYMSG